MKFPRFYNPFRRVRELEETLNGMYAGKRKLRATIREQRDVIEGLRDQESGLSRQVAFLERQSIEIGHNWLTLYNEVSQDLSGHEQANEAFMLEREELKANIQLRDAIGIQLVASLMAAEEVITANDANLQLAEQANEELAAEVLTLRQEVQQQAGEVAETVGYVKACEEALKVVGITIVDTASGPEVAVDQEAFLSALRLGFIRAAEVEAA